MGLFSSQQLGIEVGTTSVRVVGVSSGRKPAFIGCKEVPFTQHELPAIAQAIRQALKAAAPHSLHAKAATILIPEKEVFRKTIELPTITNDNEQREALRLELAGFLPDGSEATEFDYQLLGALEGGKVQQFMVVAAARDLIERYTTALKLAGLKTVAVDTVPAALGRATVAVSESKAAVIVAIDETSSSISLYRHGSVWVSSTVNQGLDQEVDTSPEKLKRLSGMLADEVDHVVKFYENRAAGNRGQLTGIRIIGAGHQIDAIKTTLEKELDLKSEAAKPVLSVPAFCDATFLPSLGAALYGRYESL